MFTVEFPGRGYVTWRNGIITVDGGEQDALHQLKDAVTTVLEMERVDLHNAKQVRRALLTMVGARVVKDTTSHDGRYRH